MPLQIESSGAYSSNLWAENPENMAPEIRSNSRQKFFDLAHEFFRNGAKNFSFWRKFFRPSAQVGENNTSAYFFTSCPHFFRLMCHDYSLMDGMYIMLCGLVRVNLRLPLAHRSQAMPRLSCILDAIPVEWIFGCAEKCNFTALLKVTS
ncbi:hypothetical protein [Porphyromonas loveana]|uniref:hypothetical protein n=1 Tax=Porphyromonas loveana TaxID=1884669 RepID=UPI0035A04255